MIREGVRRVSEMQVKPSDSARLRERCQAMAPRLQADTKVAVSY